MCMMCMILAPNCCTVTIVEYSSTDVTLLPIYLFIYLFTTTYTLKGTAIDRLKYYKSVLATVDNN